MNVKLKLTKNTSIKLTEPFNCQEAEDVVFDFESEYDLRNSKITLQNGDLKETYNFENQFLVPDKFMVVGNLFCTLEMFLNERLIKKWEFMPIQISETQNGLYIADFLTSLDERLKRIERFQEII